MDYNELMGVDIPIAAAIATCGNSIKIEMVNAEFVRLFGYTERDLAQMGAENMISKQDIYLLEETVAQAVLGQRVAENQLS